MKRFVLTSASLFLLVLFVFSHPLYAQKPIWTASGSIDNDGDGVPDRTLSREGFDDDGDGKADRKVTKEDKNGDGDFDDPGETETEIVTGNAKAEIEMTDPVTGVTTNIKAEDTNGNGKFDKKEIKITHPKPKVLAMASTDCTGSSPVGETVPLGGSPLGPPGGPPPCAPDDQVINVTWGSNVPHPDGGCENPHDKDAEWQRDIITFWFDDTTQVRGSVLVDLDGDGIRDDAFGLFPTKAARTARHGPPGSFGFPFGSHPSLCETIENDTGMVQVVDENLDGGVDGLLMDFDPGATTIKAEIRDIVPIYLPHWGTGTGGRYHH